MLGAGLFQIEEKLHACDDYRSGVSSSSQANFGRVWWFGGQLISYLLSADLVGELKKAVESDEFQINIPVEEDE